MLQKAQFVVTVETNSIMPSADALQGMILMARREFYANGNPDTIFRTTARQVAVTSSRRTPRRRDYTIGQKQS